MLLTSTLYLVLCKWMMPPITTTQLTNYIGGYGFCSCYRRSGVHQQNEFYEGVYLACEKYNVDLIGGDTSSSKKGFVISVTAIGEVAPWLAR